METLLNFALWAGLIFLMMRFGCGAHAMGHGRGGKTAHDNTGSDDSRELRWVAPQKDVDPVCGQAVATDTAKPSVFDGNIYYFCSRECREVFEAAPDVYARGEHRRGAQQLEHSHV